MDNIFAKIRSEARDFYNNDIEVVPGYVFNQYETIKRAHLYISSKYEEQGMINGKEPLFFNVVNAPNAVAARMMNVDTKNIKLKAVNEESYYKTYLLEKELKHWLKKSDFAKVLNVIAEELPQFGSTVVQKTSKTAKVVDLRRLILDPTVENIRDSRFVTIVHYMTPSQLRETGWDNVEEAISQFSTPMTPTSYEDLSGQLNQIVSSPYIKVYEHYGEVPRKWLSGGKANDVVRAQFFVAGADSVQTDSEGNVTAENGLILSKSRWYKDWPFQDFHYGKIRGRWLGVGVTETLFDVQTRVNELSNQKRISMELSAMHLFQSRDNTVVRNALTDLQSGDIILAKSEITPVANEERNLAAFKDEEAKYMQQADRLSFAFEAVRGEQLPSSTPATNAVLATQQATSVFGFKRENLTNALRVFFNEWVLPQAIRELSAEHIMRFTGSTQELAKIDEAASVAYANDVVKRAILNGKRISRELYDMHLEEAKKKYRQFGENRFLKVKEAFYKNAEFDFDFIIGNEQEDPMTMMQNVQAVFTTIAKAPQLLEDPLLKMLLYKWAETLGVSPAEMELADAQATEMKSQAMQQQAGQAGQMGLMAQTQPAGQQQPQPQTGVMPA